MRQVVVAALISLALLAAGCSESKPDCMGGAVVCAGSCADLGSDNLNCGACGNACEAGKVCSSGACALTCQAGLVNCGGSCIDPATDRTHCGASGACTGAQAGVACASGEVCAAGVCDTSCPVGQVDCNGWCVDPLTDRLHCGASGDCAGANAGVSCAAGEVCSGGACGLSCQAGLVNCGGKCVDPMTDRAYCGASGDCTGVDDGTVCVAGEVCSAGTCALSCQFGLVDCAGKCVDTQLDNWNCGGCERACAAGQVCSSGACQLSCQAGLVDCSGRCVDPLTDRAFCGVDTNCGGGAVCGPGYVCSSGICAQTCPAGEYACGGRCVDPQSDPYYCGAAAADCTGGMVCAPNQACNAGVCRDLACFWEEVYFHDLASTPTEATWANGAAGGQGVQSVYGRNAWYQTSDWNWLVFPISLTGSDDVFAVQSDVYMPAYSGYLRDISMFLFDTASPGAGYGTHGFATFVFSTGPTSNALGWWFYPDASGTWRRLVPVKFPTAGWHTLRVEGRRSACSFNVLVDGALVDAYSTSCDTTGANLSLVGTAAGATNVAWSNLRVLRGNAACWPRAARSCAEILLIAPGAPSGGYTIDPDGLGGSASYDVYCDMTTDGGGWTLALAYQHPANDTTALRPGIAPVDPLVGYSHLSAAQLAALPFTSMRFYCESSAHTRKIHAAFSAGGAISYVKGVGSNAVSYWQSHVPLAGHSGFLPAATDFVESPAADERLTFFPFLKFGSYHWGIRGSTQPGIYRFECDDYPASATNATLHQVWVR